MRLLAPALFIALCTSLGAQEPDAAAAADRRRERLRVAGHLVRLTVDGEQPIRAGRVTLHRIGRTSGPVDSLLTSAIGAFAFDIAADSSSMYVATARHHGIAYSSAPARLGEANGEFEIVTFDTTSQPLRIGVAGRHLIVSLPDARGDRTVIDVLEIENDSVLTRVSAPGRPVFTVPLPNGAVRPTTSQGDFIGSSVDFVDGEARVHAPVPPGVRQLVLKYVLPAAAMPVGITLTVPVAVLEVLVEEPEATVTLTGADLSAGQSVTTEGRTFRRSLGSAVPSGSVVTIAPPVTSSGGIAGALGIMLLSTAGVTGLWYLGQRRRRRMATWDKATDQLLRSVSALDAVLADPATSDAARSDLAAVRAQKFAEAQSRLARQGTRD
jgi:hypothetical protein